MAQIKSYDTLSDVKEHVKRGRVISKGAKLKIASGVVTATDSYHLIQSEGAGGDLLDTINFAVTAQPGQLLVLGVDAAQEATGVITVKNGTGNVVCGADRQLDGPHDGITLMWMGDKWAMLSYADNGGGA